MIDLDKLDEWVRKAQPRSVDHTDVTVDPETTDFSKLAPGIYRVDENTNYLHVARLPIWGER